MGVFRIIQPYGRDAARESTLISEHTTAAAAFAEIDRLSAQIIKTGVRPDVLELLVIDGDGQLVSRPGTH